MATNVDRLLFKVAENGYSGAVDGRWKDVQKVAKLPKFGQSGILYKVPKNDAEGNNLYNEWFWTGTEFKLFMENVDDTASAGTHTVDTNTTYTLVKDPGNGRTIVLKGSDGTEQAVTIDESTQVDTNTTYTMDVRDGKIVLTPSDGSAAQEFSLPIQDVSGLATKEELQEVKNAIPPAYNDAEIKQKIADVKNSIPTVPDVSGLVTKDELKKVEDKVTTLPKISYNDLTDKPTIPAAYDDKELREGLQKVQKDVAGITDSNTTYTLEKDPYDPYTVHLKGSDGSDSPVTFPDKDTVYDDEPLRKEIADVKASIPAAYDDKNLRDLIQGLSDRIAALESGGATETPTVNEEGAVTIPKATTEEDGTATLPDATIDDNGIVTLK